MSAGRCGGSAYEHSRPDSTCIWEPVPNEPTVQVPVSMIHELVETVGSKGMPTDLYLRFDALLPQPPPTAEPFSFVSDQDVRDAQADYDALIAAAPPRIEGMAPGTTFTADLADDRIDAPRLRRVWRVQEAPGVVWNDEQNFGVRERRIDPSTIRDVTPPPA